MCVGCVWQVRRDSAYCLLQAPALPRQRMQPSKAPEQAAPAACRRAHDAGRDDDGAGMPEQATGVRCVHGAPPQPRLCRSVPSVQAQVAPAARAPAPAAGGACCSGGQRLRHRTLPRRVERREGCGRHGAAGKGGDSRKRAARRLKQGARHMPRCCASRSRGSHPAAAAPAPPPPPPPPRAPAHAPCTARTCRRRERDGNVAQPAGLGKLQASAHLCMWKRSSRPATSHTKSAKSW